MGWARFDDQYSDHPKIIQAGPLAELLDMRAVIYCARYETDGWLDRAALARLSAGIPSVAKKARALVDCGRWHAKDHECNDCPEVFGDGFYVHAFLTYNPSSEAKQADREAARDRMRAARQSKRAPRSSPEHSPNERANNNRSSDNPVPVPVPVPVPLVNSSVNSCTSRAAEPVDDDDQHRARQVLERVADARMARQNGIKDRTRYRATVMAELERDEQPKLLELIRTHPRAPIDVLAGAICGEPNSLRLYRQEAAG